MYRITVKNLGKGCVVRSVTVYGVPREDMIVHLVDDGAEYDVMVEIGE
ncbi:hypothetical protein [Methanolacinia paynteri]|nr:hypothetical protein [Methanolacinia paynteri]